jgi:hypothetical protein
MKYNQQAVDDLLSPLRYVNLKDIDPNSINRIGEGVFPELTTLDHLSILDLVTKAYQAVHLPTLGHPIPQSTVYTTATLPTSNGKVNVVTASNNEVIEILGISVKTPNEYETSGLILRLVNSLGDERPIFNFDKFDLISTDNGAPIIYGKVIKLTSNLSVSPSPLYVNGGDTLQIVSNSAPNDDMVMDVVYRKVIQ